MHSKRSNPLESGSFLNDTIKEKNIFRQRVIIFVCLILFLTFILFLRLFYLQIIKHTYYSTASRENSIGTNPIIPPRGMIYDREGRVLAENFPVFSLDVIPNQTSHLKETIETLQKLLAIDPSDINRFYAQLKQHREFEAIPLKIQLSESELAKFYVNQYRFPGVKISTRFIRSYPYKADMAPVLGYTGRISIHELKQIDDMSNYAGDSYIGKLGIERFYEKALHGTVGFEQIETNAIGQPLRTLQSISPTAGASIYLTIDAPLQEATVAAMKNFRGAVVVIDPRNGDVLALVSNPSYDPNLFVRGITHEEYRSLREDPGKPLLNRAIRGQYPPGSTVKPILALKALAEKDVTPEFQIYDPGYFQITPTSRKYRNWRPEGQGWINARSAIEQSCDTYFYWLSLKMGIEQISSIMTAFGFGQKTGIQLSEELPGLVPTPAEKLKRMGQPWYPGDTLNTSIGQGLTLATPLQIAVAVSIIANRGVYYQPNLVKKIQEPNGKVINIAPTQREKVNAPDIAWDTVIAGMQDVITSARGTGYHFGDPAYTVAAKTGTAQLFDLGANQKYNASKVAEHLRDNSMFIAFAPIKHPKIAIAVAIQNNSAAASIARQVVDYYLITEKHLFTDTDEEDFVKPTKKKLPPKKTS